MSEIKPPNLFVVGEPKTGTTALYHFLNQHPNIQMSSVKEPNTLATDYIRQCRKHKSYWTVKPGIGVTELDKYLDLFADMETKYRGEASTCYAFSEEAIHNIARISTNPHIIYSVRDPVEWLISYFNQLRRSGAETKRSLKKALQIEGERMQKKRAPYYAKRPQGLWYTERIRFLNNLNRIRETVGSENVKVILQEDLKNSSQKCFDELCEFLDVDTISLTTADYNTAVNPTFPLLKKSVEISKIWKPVKNILPRQAYEALKDIFVKVIF